jgi:glycerophosphoryl diester phosphodiesterase
LLVEDEIRLSQQLDQLGFLPDVYSPDFVLLDEGLAKSVHERGMKLIPWTVNEPADLERIAALGVDGIITDYPDRAVQIFINTNS